MSISYTVSTTVQTPTQYTASGASAAGLKPGKRTFSLTGVLGTGILNGDAVALWGSNDGGSTYQPIRQNGAPVQLNYQYPEVVIDDCCDHYATNRVSVAPGSTLAAIGLNGEATGINANPAWVRGGNAGFGPTGVLGTTDSPDVLSVIAQSVEILNSDGLDTLFGNAETGKAGNSLQFFAGAGGGSWTIDGGGNLALTAASPGTIELAGLAVRVRRSTAGVVVPFELFDATDAAFVGLKAPNAVSASYTITMPTAAPAVNGQALTATTAGVGSFAGATNLQVANISQQVVADGAAAAVLINWSPATVDSRSAFDVATGVFTAPATGFYFVTAEVEFEAVAAIVGAEFTVGVVLNGAMVAQGVEVVQVAAANVNRNPKVCVGLQMVAGNTMTIRVSQSSGSGNNALTNSAVRNFLSIAQVI